MSAPGHLEEIHPFCAANPVEVWPGAGARDRIEYYNARVVERRFAAWWEGAGYDLVASDRSGPRADVSWRIAPVAGGSEVTISLRPRPLGRHPAVARWVLRPVLARPMMRRYLRAVVAGLRWRVETGSPVQRNQFGSHPWFSQSV